MLEETGKMPIRFGEFELDEGRRQLLRGGTPIHLAPKEFLLLQILLERRPDVVSKQDLYDRLWPSTYVSEVNLPSLIKDLRTALGDDPHESRFIRTVYGFGYAFCGEADPPPAAEPAVGWLSNDRWRIRITAGETLIGRDPTLTASIDDASISRRHAVIRSADGRFVIRDLGSKNGTFVGGIRITDERELADNDVVTLGGVRLQFCRATVASTVTLGPPR